MYSFYDCLAWSAYWSGRSIDDMEPRGQSVLGKNGQAITDALVSDLEIIITSWFP
jgi:hypothetical protein